MSDQHTAFRLLQYQAQVLRRQRLSLGQRLDDALERAKLVTAARGSTLEKQAPSAEEESSGVPSASIGLLYEPGVESPHETFKYRATVLVELLEREVDATRAAPIFGDATKETQEERDRRLLDYVRRGLPVKVIDLLDPAQGGARAIRQSLKRLDA